jgi:hypothetical protein
MLFLKLDFLEKIYYNQSYRFVKPVSVLVIKLITKLKFYELLDSKIFKKGFKLYRFSYPLHGFFMVTFSENKNTLFLRMVS